MSDDVPTVTTADGETLTIEEYKKRLEHGNLGIPTEYDDEYRPITLTDFLKDVFRIDLRKIKKKMRKNDEK